MINDYKLIDKRIQLEADAGQVIAKVREVYLQCKTVQTLVARFASDPAFSDEFDRIMGSDGFDGTAAISQMLFNVNALCTAWEANQSYKDVLLIP